MKKYYVWFLLVGMVTYCLFVITVFLLKALYPKRSESLQHQRYYLCEKVENSKETVKTITERKLDKTANASQFDL